jgi:hypothetical protein
LKVDHHVRANIEVAQGPRAGGSYRFDFGQVAAQLSRVDLRALRPFLNTMLALNRRKVRDGENGLTL